MMGDDIDKETTELLGRPVYHRDCIGSCLNMMEWQLEYGTLKEDRPVKIQAGDSDEEVSIQTQVNRRM